METMNQPLLVALTFDIEADTFDRSLSPNKSSRQTDDHFFQGIAQGVPLLKTYLQSLRDDYGQPACATWFVRCDDQIESQTGRADFLLAHYAHLWERFIEDGDEIGFHAHLYELVQGSWQQAKDDVRNCSQLVRSHCHYAQAGFEVITSRIGESYFSNALLTQLAALGVRADSTAMPGRVRSDEQRCIDWAGTPDVVYQPACENYRIPQPVSASDSLLQVPFTMMQTRSDYDNAPLTRYLDLSFHERVFRPALGEMIEQLDLLVSVTHPSTVLPELDNGGHGLLSFSMQAFVNNLDAIMRACQQQSRPFRFVTLGQAVADGLIAEGMRTGPRQEEQHPESMVA